MMSTQEEYLQEKVSDNSIQLKAQRNHASLHPPHRRDHDLFHFNSAGFSHEPFIVDWQMAVEEHG